jgi:hypothetical protein
MTVVPPWEVTDVSSPHEFVRLAGWRKFEGDEGSQVVFRGHASLHPTCVPSGARGLNTAYSISRLAGEIRRYVDALMEGQCTCGPVRPPWYCPEVAPRHRRGQPGAGLVSGTPRAAIEPLLQHYGLRTRWVDVVDNIWVALWFACHSFVVETEAKRFAHHLRRSTAQEPDGFAYVSVISTGPIEPIGAHGSWEGPKARLIDLRVAAPSLYLRPHAQHGLLIAAAGWHEPATIDVGLLHKETLRIKLGDALEWLGDGTMLRPFVLFPPASVDHGYRRLLEYAPDPPSRLGRYIIYGPGN